MKLGIILTPDARSKAYIQKIVKNNLTIEEYIFLNNHQDEPEFSDSEINTSKNFGFDLSEPVLDTLQKNKISFTEFDFVDINHPKLIEFLESSSCDVFIFSGGGILRDNILSIGKKFIHFHPGIVPDYRGSTCFYYAILNDNKCGVTAFFMDKNLDTGKVIYQKTFEPPNHEFGDNVYDPFIRSETLVEVIKNNHYASKTLQEQSSEGETYYIIHPVLKHISILSCLND